MRPAMIVAAAMPPTVPPTIVALFGLWGAGHGVLVSYGGIEEFKDVAVINVAIGLDWEEVVDAIVVVSALGSSYRRWLR